MKRSVSTLLRRFANHGTYSNHSQILPPRRSFSVATHDPGSPDYAPSSPGLSGTLQTLCKLTLIGRTGTAPHLHTFPNGRTSVRLRVATNHLQRAAHGDREVATQWLTVFVSDVASAFEVVRDVPVGSLIYVEGNLRVVDRPSSTGAVGFANVHVDRAGVLRVLVWNRSSNLSDDADIFPKDE